MKKKITFGLVAFAMVAASAVFMKSIAKDDLSALIQANVVECSGTTGNATYWGQMVKCNTGDGNCYDGTGCI